METYNDKNMTAFTNSETDVKAIENPKWNDKFNFKDIDEKHRQETIEVYNAYEEELNKLDKQFFVAYAGGKSLVYQISEDINDELKTFSHHEFKNHYGNRTFPKMTGIKKGLPQGDNVRHYIEWLKHENRRQYDLGIKFYPGQLSEYEAKNYYNLWRGFPIEGKKGDFSKIDYHLKHVWCRNNMEHYTYLMAWLADIIQNPTQKSGVALVVKGGKGLGKSLIVERLLYPIFGYTYIKIDKAEQITGKFNQHLLGKLFVVLEEAIWAGDKAAEGTLKSLITDRRTMLEGKGTNAQEMDTYCRLVFISNEKQAVPASIDERRFFALKVSEEYFGNEQYFNELIYEIEHGGIESFMYHLQNIDISKINVRKAPRTEALFDDIYANMTTVERFLYELLQEDYVYLEETLVTNYTIRGTNTTSIYPGIAMHLWDSKISKVALFKYFEKWEREILKKNVYIPKHDITTQKGLVREINKIMFFKEIKIKGEHGYELPSKEMARKMFESKVKCKIIWNDDIAENMTDEEYAKEEREIQALIEILDRDERQQLELEVKEKQKIDNAFFNNFANKING